MFRIYKYGIPGKDYFSLPLPKGAKILTIQEQHGGSYLWALVDPEQPVAHRSFRLAETNEAIKEEGDSLEYIGTFQLYGGSYVAHLFEIKRVIVEHPERD